MFNVEKLKSEIDLREFAGKFTPLTAKTHQAKEMTGPCPICGGTDRFNVRRDRWLCRVCTSGKWRDLIAFAAHVWELDDKNPANFREICQRLNAEDTPDFIPKSKLQRKFDFSEDAPPSSDWIKRARSVVKTCQVALWSGEYPYVLDWLMARKLSADTIQRFHLGYNAVSRKIAGHWVYGGLIIPHWDGKTMWAVKIRLNKEGMTSFCQIHGTKQAPKYILIKGSKQNVFNLNSLLGHKQAFVVEGELDAILLDQEIGDRAGAITLGSASNQLGDRWLPPLMHIMKFYLCLDNDKSGRQSQKCWAKLVGKRGYSLSLPDGIKDITEYAIAEKNLRSWLLEQMGLPQHPHPFKIIRFKSARLHNILPPFYRQLPNGEVECIYYTVEQMREHIHTVTLIDKAIGWGGVLTQPTKSQTT